MYGSQQDLHLINKTLTVTAAGGNAIPPEVLLVFSQPSLLKNAY